MAVSSKIGHHLNNKAFLKIELRGHSTTTWTRRGVGGVSKKSTLVHPGGGGSQDVHVDKIFYKGTEESWQMMMKILISLIFVQL